MNVQAVVNAADLNAFVDAFDQALTMKAVNCVSRIAAEAESKLRDFDQRLGHFALAGLWTYDAKPIEDGAMAEVWSTAEQVTFFNRTTSARDGRVKSSLYPIDGKRLLAILEGGAVPHGIRTRRAHGVPTIPLRGTEELRDEMRHRGPAAPEEGDTEFRKSVQHPGVAANNNIATVARIIEDATAAYAERASDDIGGAL